MDYNMVYNDFNENLNFIRSYKSYLLDFYQMHQKYIAFFQIIKHHILW